MATTGPEIRELHGYRVCRRIPLEDVEVGMTLVSQTSTSCWQVNGVRKPFKVTKKSAQPGRSRPFTVWRVALDGKEPDNSRNGCFCYDLDNLYLLDDASVNGKWMTQEKITALNYGLGIAYMQTTHANTLGLSPGHSLMNAPNTYPMYVSMGTTTTANIPTLAKILKPKTLMENISLIAKKILDKDTRTLIKAGYLDNALNLTSAGQAALNSIIADAHKAELVALATEKLAEEKEDNA